MPTKAYNTTRIFLFLGGNISALGNRTSSHAVPRVSEMESTNYPSGSLGVVMCGATLVSISHFLDPPNWDTVKMTDLECIQCIFEDGAPVLRGLPLSWHFSCAFQQAIPLLHYSKNQQLLIGVVGDMTSYLMARYQVPVPSLTLFKADPLV